MKKRIFLLFFIPIILLISCNKNKKARIEIVEYDPLEYYFLKKKIIKEFQEEKRESLKQANEKVELKKFKEHNIKNSIKKRDIKQYGLPIDYFVGSTPEEKSVNAYKYYQALKEKRIKEMKKYLKKQYLGKLDKKFSKFFIVPKIYKDKD